MNKFSIEYVAREVIKTFRTTDYYKEYISIKQISEFYLGKEAFTTQIHNTFGLAQRDSKVVAMCNRFFKDLIAEFPESNKSGRYAVEHIKVTDYSFLMRVTGPTLKSNSSKWIMSKVNRLKAELLKNLVDIYGTAKKDLSVSTTSSEGKELLAAALVKEVESFFNKKFISSKKQIDNIIAETVVNIGSIFDKQTPKVSLTISSDRPISSKISDKDLNVLSTTITKIVEPAIVQNMEQNTFSQISKGLKGVKNIKLTGFEKKTLAKISKKVDTLKVANSVDYMNFGTVTNELNTSSRISGLDLLKYINTRLHDEIKERMQYPALVYRTGRFARSARATEVDLIKNRIDFTYMMEPYGLFEYPKGCPRRATPDRDPRKIIGNSIREIAAQVVANNFSVRRVV